MTTRQTSSIDCERDDDLGTRIRKLTEKLAIQSTYRESSDTGLLKEELESLQELEKKLSYG